MKNNKTTKSELSWILYDVANSSFILIIITSIGQLFFKKNIAENLSDASATSYWAYTVTISALILAILAPIVGTIADYKGYKKRGFILLLMIGLLATALLTITGQGQIYLYLVLIIIAWLGFAGANILYDAFLIDITTDERMDWISSSGFAWGYIGSLVPFLLCIIIIFASSKVAILSETAAIKTCFIIVCIWWLFFSIPLLKNVKQQYYIEKSKTPIRDSFSRLIKTFKEIKKNKNVFIFILAYFLYIDGVYTIIKLAASYAHDIGLSMEFLLVVLFAIQLVAFPFTLIYGKLTKIISTKTLIKFGISIYIVITIIAFAMPFFKSLLIRQFCFWIMSLLVACSQGGIQALSRSLYAKIIPRQKSAEFFGFYNAIGRFSAISGPLFIGLASSLIGDSRYGILSLSLLFIIGLILLSRVKTNEREVIN